ncbi:MAG: hypothetical protein COA67_07065 [Lutibacter sp.]|nr:MAG: hypothetical protein COA67_07065 [Lutibacter sp.]
MKSILRVSILIFLISNTSSFAQGFQGKAYYQTKTTFDMKMDSSRVSTEQQDRIKEMMKKRFEKVYELSFNASESIYKEEEQLEQPGKGGFRMMGSFGSGKNYKNTKSKTYAEEQNLMGKQFLVKDSLKVMDWEFQDESKMIGKHLCFKAIATKQVEQNAFSFGRRNRNRSEEEKPKDSLKTIEIVAWYTVDIPVNHGPDEYWGLPGLILEVNADKTQIVCTKIVINPKEKTEIKEPTKGDVVSKKEFEKIRMKKMKEMREVYGGDRRNGGSGRRIMIGG